MLDDHDPWAPPAPPTRAHAWGYPTGPIGESRPGPGGPGLGTAGLVAIVAVTALLAGTVGGVVGYRSARDELPSAASLRDPGVELGQPTADTSPVVRPATSVAGIAARVLKSVVSISVDEETGSGTGSGVVLSADGFVLTNNHVVEGAAVDGTIVIAFNDGRTDLPARVVGRDPETDLAVLKIVGVRGLTPAALGSSSGLVVGDPVVAIGSPLGLAGSVTSGIVSALDRTVRVPERAGEAPSSPLFDAIQTDAAINPGNSGGPLVDMTGRVVGITTAIATLGGLNDTQSGSIGVGFAIPVDAARSIAEQLIRTGKAAHPVIGVSAGTVGADGSGPRGARISGLVNGGPAADAGLRVGDVITAVAGRRVLGVDELIVMLRRYRVGERVELTYVRAGKTRTAQVVLEDKPTN